MTSDWYKTAFGPHYSDFYSHRNQSDAHEAVDFIRTHVPDELLRGAILDLCCGAGRHSIELLSKIPEARITGFDLSAHLLEIAARGSQSIRYVRGDMRSLPFLSESFSLIINLFTSFGYFADEHENARALHEAARVLQPRGAMVLDHMNPTWLRANLRPESARFTPGGLHLREKRAIDMHRRRVEKETHFQIEGREHRLFESVRLYEPEEMRDLAAKAGLIGETIFGDFSAKPLSSRSQRAIYLFRKA